MSLAHWYQEFGRSTGLFMGDPSDDTRDVDSEKLQSFEEGYQAGWEDSLKAQTDTTQKTVDGFVQNLQEVSFAYHEARTLLTQALKPLFEGIFSKVLPEAARLTTGTHIVEQLTVMARSQLDQPVEIVVPEADLETLEAFLHDKAPEPFAIVPDADLDEGQVYLRIGSQEREIDFASMIESMRNSTMNLFEEEPAND